MAVHIDEAKLETFLGQVLGDLAVEPLAHVALGAARPLGDLHGRQWPGTGQRVVEAEPVAQAGHDAAVAGGQVAEHLAQERLQLRFVYVDGHGSP